MISVVFNAAIWDFGLILVSFSLESMVLVVFDMGMRDDSVFDLKICDFDRFRCGDEWF